jgi:hypothetical protein
MLGFYHRIDHSLQHVFNQKIQHCPKKCQRCYLNSMTKTEHILDYLPLVYQDTNFTSEVRRFGFVIDMTDVEIPGTSFVKELFEEFSCDVTRSMNFRCKLTLPPTKEALTDEFFVLSKCLQANSHVFLHAIGGHSEHKSGDFFCGNSSNLSNTEFSLQLEKFSSNTTLWGTLDFPSASKFCGKLCMYKYELSTDMKVVTYELDVINKILANLFFFALEEDISGRYVYFTKPWVETVVESHYRISVFDLLVKIRKKLPNGFKLVLYSSKKLTNLRKIYFGFG